MQFANVMVRLGGHLGNTVPRYQVSAAEIAVLRAIHGPDSVYDVDPVDASDVDDSRKLKNRDELQRIREAYAGPNSTILVNQLFPGISARVPETIDELGLDESHFKAETRAKPRSAGPTAAARAAAAVEADDEHTAPKPRGRAAKAAAKADEATAEAEQAGVARVQNAEAVEDGVADMPDSGLLG